ncbi:MAG: IS66 family transposase [Solirubrobacteraceae bacterium]
MDRAEAEAIYDAGREVVVEVLLRMDRQIQQLTARVERLERELAKNSRNSSRPPSSDPPGKKPKRREKGRSGREQGGQPGHEGKGRDLLPCWAVDEVVEHWPDRCGCGHVFADLERGSVREPARHQVEELPRIATVVVEHQCQRLRCPECGEEQTGELPAEVAGSAFGPRLQAAVATLAVRNRVSRRDTVELCSELFGARISAGSVDAILTRAADALEVPHQELVGALRRSGRLNVDETGWRLKGGRRTLWGAFTDKLAVYRICENRHEDRARELLGSSTAIVTSDRWWAYNHLPLARRQVCWSHLRRDFQAQAEGLGAEQEFGELGLRVCEEVFWAWEIYQHTGERKELKRRVRLLRRELKPLLRTYSGKAPRYKRTRGLARNLLKVWPALWTFADRRGVQPTNNHAERALRGAVIYRKLSLGSQSETGEQRIERLLSASTTCRLQRRSMFEYLSQLLTAHARGDPLPRLA